MLRPRDVVISARGTAAELGRCPSTVRRALARNTDPGCAALRFGQACPADDLVAVTLLSVEVPGPVALGVLEGKHDGQVDSLLTQIPTDIALHEPGGPELMATGSAARPAWDLLEEPWGMGWVVTSKVRTRKRPHLVPADDNVVKCALGNPGSPSTGCAPRLPRTERCWSTRSWPCGKLLGFRTLSRFHGSWTSPSGRATVTTTVDHAALG